jgi:protein-tyrosine phosphatase
VLDIDDMPDFNIDEHFEEAHKFIKNGITNGEGVLVVCTAGISRSASIVISYLIREHKMLYEDAY